MAQISRRCPNGCQNWPDQEDYSLCPACGKGTRRFRGLKPISAELAESARKHAEFEHYYATEHVPDSDLETFAGAFDGPVPPA